MVVKLNWRPFKEPWIRLNAVWRCLRKKHYVLVCWDKCPDGDVDFKISHKGCELPEAVHRIGVDATEILQDLCDQETALLETSAILNK